MVAVFYGNGDSGNHGCEAIARGTIKLLGQDNSYLVQSANCEADWTYGLGELAKIFEAHSPIPRDLHFLIAYLKQKMTGNYTDMDGLRYLPGIEKVKGCADVALSMGGDNYCYSGVSLFAYLNRAYRKCGLKTVLWGCSIEPEVTAEPEVARDLAAYDLVVARESITYEAVKKVQKNTILAPDPAFFMEEKSCQVDTRLDKRRVIGVNASPLILDYETTAGMAYENYKQLIRYILETTDAIIALIPHVVWESNDDRKVLRQLYDDFDQNPRLVLVEDHNAPELKYIISKCEFFVGARTHATIAAYSTCVPTLVVGYSVKARGIARDLFGTEDGYVLPVQELKHPLQLVQAFIPLWNQRDSIRLGLEKRMTNYKNAGCTGKKLMELLAR